MTDIFSKTSNFKPEAIEKAVVTMLDSIGEQPSREGLQRTPKRVAKMYAELTQGYHTDPIKLVNDALFHVDYAEMVVVKDIEFCSLCEHHLLPFFGKAHVAYLPDDKVIGLSKIPRIVEMFAQRLQVQERITSQIANLIEDILNPRGTAVVVEGVHMCSAIRGVKKIKSSMITSAFTGAFKENQAIRAEFMNHLNRHSNLYLG